MKIPLAVKDYLGGPKPFMTFFLSIPHASGYVEAFVDTGGPLTILMPRDTDRLHFPFQASKKGLPHYIAGLTFQAYEFEKATIVFRDEEKNRLRKNISITALKPIKLDDKSLQKAHQLPSIIGMDFLIDQDLSLYFYPRGKIAHLQSEESKST